MTIKNRGKSIEAILKNIEGLLNSSDELIVVDSLSKIDPAAFMKKYRKLVNVYISEPDISPTHAFNKGIMLARGKYIKNISDDDIIYPEAMEKAIKVLGKNKDIDLLICGGSKMIGRNIRQVYVPPGIEYGKNYEDFFNYGACGVGFITRRSSIPLIGLYPSRVSSDVAYALQSLERGGKVRFCRVNLFVHKVKANSTIIKNSKFAERDSYELMKQYCSAKFYYTFRIKNYLKSRFRMFRSSVERSPLLRVLLFPIRVVMIKKNLGTKMPILRWDGDFS
ncbi:MAG: glycosyltransferase family 2 protein [Candidatus Curtissbacteria bacterium]|nr:glycosyltransferase family 2 protein [Candidatus Curtissbacteria bacterium]